MSIQNGESKMWMGAYLPDYPDAESYLNPYYSLSEGKSIRAFGMYKNSKFDELYEKSTIEVDEKVRNQHFNSCLDIMNREAPVVPVYFENILVVYNFTNEKIRFLLLIPLIFFPIIASWLSEGAEGDEDLNI